MENIDLGFAWTPHDVELALHANVRNIDRTDVGKNLLRKLKDTPTEQMARLVREFHGNMNAMLAFMEDEVDDELEERKKGNIVDGADEMIICRTGEEESYDEGDGRLLPFGQVDLRRKDRIVDDQDADGGFRVRIDEEEL